MLSKIIPAGQNITSHNFIMSLEENLKELKLLVGDETILNQLLNTIRMEGKLTGN